MSNSNLKSIKTRIQNKHELEVNWERSSLIPLKGEVIIYDKETTNDVVNADGSSKLRSGRTVPYTYERFKIGDGVLGANGSVTGTSVNDLPFATMADENTTKLAEDLYTYTPIGKITSASNTSPTKVASRGATLKDVFNKVFGTQQKQQPTINTDNVKLNVNAGTTSYGGGEYGTAVAKVDDLVITFTLANSGTTNYGYRYNNTKATGSRTFYYPIEKQAIAEGSETKADIKITLPSDKTASAGMVVTAENYVAHNNNILYCNLDNNNQVKIKISLDEDTVSTLLKTRYDKITAAVKLGRAQTASGDSITAFLEFTGTDADDQSKLTIAEQSNEAGPYTISAGAKYTYYAVTSTADVPTSWKKYANSTSVVGLSVNANAGQYVWIASTSKYNYLRLFNEVNGQYNNEDACCSKTTQSAEISNSQGVKASGYYFYATGPRKNTGKVKLKLSNSLTD